MNEKKIVKYLMMKIIEKADDGISELNNPNDPLDEDFIRTMFKDIEFYARMIIEDG